MSFIVCRKRFALTRQRYTSLGCLEANAWLAFPAGCKSHFQTQDDLQTLSRDRSKQYSPPVNHGRAVCADQANYFKKRSFFVEVKSTEPSWLFAIMRRK
jgi:hypothetical protein